VSVYAISAILIHEWLERRVRSTDVNVIMENTKQGKESGSWWWW